MSNIHEALLRSEQEKKARLKIVDTLPVAPVSEAVPATPPPPEKHLPAIYEPPSEIPFETHMASMYTPIIAKLDGQPGTIMFVGVHDGSGTSTVANSFASFMANSVGESVLIIDGNRQKPSQRARYGITMDVDLEDVVREGLPLERAIYPIGNTGLHVASLAKAPTNRPFVANPTRLADIFGQLNSRFGMVIIDCPSPIIASEAKLFASTVKGVVLVIEAGKTSMGQAKYVKEQIASAGGQFIGMVMNKQRFYIPNWLYRRL